MDRRSSQAQIGDVKIDLPHNNRMKEYLDKLWSKAWTMSEFNKECAYWLITCEGLRPLALPTRPQELKEYDTWSPAEKKNTADKFWRQESIYSYLNQKQFVKDRNRGILSTLKEFKEYIPKEDTITREKYDSYIESYDMSGDIINDFDSGNIERGFKDK